MATKQEKDHSIASVTPHKKDAETRTVTLKCSTGKGDAKNQTDFEADMPASLLDAIALEGVNGVFKRYLSSLAIELQGQKRQELAPEGEKAPRKRASYLEELGV